MTAPHVHVACCLFSASTRHSRMLSNSHSSTRLAVLNLNFSFYLQPTFCRIHDYFHIRFVVNICIRKQSKYSKCPQILKRKWMITMLGCWVTMCYHYITSALSHLAHIAYWLCLTHYWVVLCQRGFCARERESLPEEALCGRLYTRQHVDRAATWQLTLSDVQAYIHWPILITTRPTTLWK